MVNPTHSVNQVSLDSFSESEHRIVKNHGKDHTFKHYLEKLVLTLDVMLNMN